MSLPEEAGVKVGIHAVRTTSEEYGVLIEFDGDGHVWELQSAKHMAGMLADVIRCLECKACGGKAAMFEAECRVCGGLQHN